MNASAQPATATVAASFAEAVAQCRGCDYTIDWWTRGGEPGPGNTSDKLTVTTRDGFTRATYVTARFDTAYENNARAQEYSVSLNRPQADALLHALDGDGLFARTFEAEGRENLADGVKDTVRVEFARGRFEKTLVELAPDQLAQAVRARNALAAAITQQGPGRDLNKAR